MRMWELHLKSANNQPRPINITHVRGAIQKTQHFHFRSPADIQVQIDLWNLSSCCALPVSCRVFTALSFFTQNFTLVFYVYEQ